MVLSFIKAGPTGDYMNQFRIVDIYPLTPMQQGILFHNQLSDDRQLYAEQITCHLTGELQQEAFKQAWSLVVERHSALRTLYILDDEEALQLVTRDMPLNWHVLDWQHMNSEEQQLALEELKENDLSLGFTFAEEVPLRLTLVRLDYNEHFFIWRYHHVVHDGWSIPLIFGEVQRAYFALSKGGSPNLGTIPDFAGYMQFLEAQDRSRAEQFWQQYLADFTQPNSVALGFGSHNEHHSKRVVLDIAPEQINAVARKLGVTQNSFFQLAWALLIGALSGDADVVFGATSSGRPPELDEVDRMVGLFINSLPVRVKLDQPVSVAGALKQLLQEQAVARQFEYLSLTEMQKCSDLEKGANFFDTLLVFENYPDDSTFNKPEADITVSGFSMFGRNNFPLSLIVIPGNQIELKISYQSPLLSHQFIEQLPLYLVSLLKQMLSNPDKRLQDIGIKSDIVGCLHGASVVNSADTLPALFAQRCQENPDSPALLDAGGGLTYSELERLADTIATALLERGVSRGGRVAICAPKDRYLVAAMLATMKLGASYIGMPVGTKGPQIQMLLDSCQPTLLLVNGDAAAVAGLSTESTVHIKDCLNARASVPNAAINARSGDIAYVAYTSGSTGEPKGIMAPHQAVVNYLSYIAGEYQLQSGDRVLQVADINFDASVRDIWGTLCAGATLILPVDDDARDASRILQNIEAHGVTHILSLVPSLLRAVTAVAQEKQHLNQVRTLLVSGEPLAGSLVDQARHLFGAHCRIVNQYGPTECTMTTMFSDASGVIAGNVPVGQPIPNMQVWVLDASLQFVAPGCCGDIYISGQGLACGYLGMPAATANVFLPHPYAEGDRLYRTGDYARLGMDGSIQLMGRKDNLVKVRGKRIELGAVEAKLSSLPGVKECAVTVHRTSGSQQLVAWMVLTDDSGTQEVIKQMVADFPDYMLPDQWRVIDCMPLTRNGKIDRRSLSERSLPGVGQTGVKALDPTEACICEVFAEVLELDEVSRDANFFALGGNSLSAIVSIGKIGKLLNCELKLKQLFEHSSAAALAQLLRSNGWQVTLPALQPVAQRGFYPLSDVQERLWFLQQIAPTSTAYHIPVAFHIHGTLDLQRWQNAIEAVVDRHEILRTCYVERGGQVVAVAKSESQKLSCQTLLDGASEDEIQARLEMFFAQPFALSSDHPIRMLILEQNKHARVAAICVHHICADLWSLRLLLDEIIATYRLLGEQDSVMRISPALQYRDYAAWNIALRSGDLFQAQLNFWKEKLSDAPPTHSLPLDYQRPTALANRGSLLQSQITTSLLNTIHEQCREQEVTLFIFLQSVFACLIGRLSGETDVVMGTPVANRPIAETHEMMGCFMNTLVLRTIIDNELSFNDYLVGNKANLLEVFNSQLVPFEALVDALHVDRDLSRNPLFQILFSVDRENGRGNEFDGVRFETFKTTEHTAKFDLSVNISQSSQGCTVNWQYNTELFQTASVARMADAFLFLLDQVCHASDIPLKQLPLVDDTTYHQMVSHWNQTDYQYPLCGGVHQLFEAQSERTPDNIAVVFEQSECSYQQLNAQANQLSHFLIDKGVTPGDRVGICLPRGIDMVAAVVAVLKAGAAYVPLDPKYPEKRLSYLQHDSQLTVVITHSDLTGKLDPASELLCLDNPTVKARLLEQSMSNPGVETSPALTSHVIYTSGSTGNPKGVCISHSNVLALVNWGNRFYSEEETRCILGSTSLNFDLSVYEIWAALSRGGILLVVEDALSLIHRQRVQPTLINTVPTASQAILEAGVIPDSVLVINHCGEILPMKLLNGLFEGCKAKRVINLYGPSEDTTYSTVAEFKAPISADPSIGQPIDNTQAYILDCYLRPVPVGTAGELYLSGAGLSDGYHQRPDLTAKAFIPNPFSDAPGQRLYCTGDKVRWLANGEIAFIGRTDHQIKFRGYRIELSEIEYQLTRSDAVKSALVMVRQDSESPKLVAYLTPTEPDTDSEELIDFLYKDICKTLPAYMVPTDMVIMPSMPMTPNGKVDRSALPMPQMQLEDLFVPPSDDKERLLVSVWGGVLKRLDVSVTANFFELGGDSVLSILVVSRAKEHGLLLTARQLFEFQTIRALAQHAEWQEGSVQSQSAAEPVPATPLQKQLLHITGSQALALVDVPADVDDEVVSQLLQRLARRHPALQQRFREVDGVLMAEQGGTQIAYDRLYVDGLKLSTEQINALCSGLDALAGPIVRLTQVLFGNGQSTLAVAMHPAVADVQSYSAVTQDIQHLLQEQKEAGLPQQMSAAYLLWAGQVASQRETIVLQPGSEQEGNIRCSLTSLVKKQGGIQHSQSQHSVLRQLPAVLSARLQDTICQNARLDMTAFMLVALAQTLEEDGLRVDVLGDGRKCWPADVGVSGSVGQFGTIFPFVLHKSSLPIIHVVRDIKQRYQNMLLGRGPLSCGDADQGEHAELLLHSPAESIVFGDSSPVVPDMGYLMTLLPVIGDQGIELVLAYSASLFSEADMHDLLVRIEQSLEMLAETVAKDATQCLTVADFGLAELSESQLARWQDKYDIADIYPATSMQKGLLFHSALQKGSYISQNMQTMEGPLDKKAFVAAWEEVIRQHDIFRTVFVGEADQLQQLVCKNVTLPYSYFNLTGLDVQLQQEQIEAYRSEDKLRGFIADQAPLMRLAIWQLSDNRHTLLWTYHHALIDGWCIPLVFGCIVDAYQSFLDGTVPKLPVRRQYRDFIAWQRQRDIQSERDYWQAQLFGIEGSSSLPVSNTNRDRQGAGEHQFVVDVGMTEALVALCQKHHVTMSVLFQTVWSYLLARYTGQQEVIFGSIVSGRPAEIQSVESICGLFINTVPVRTKVPFGFTLTQWLADMQSASTLRQENSYLPLAEIQKIADIPLGEDLFNTLLVYENYPVDEAIESVAAGLGLKVIEARNFEGSNYPLTLTVGVSSSIKVRVFYSRTHFSEPAIQRLETHILNILYGMLDNKEQTVAGLVMTSADEQDYLVNELNATEQPYSQDVGLHQMFERQAAFRSASLAISTASIELTYGELNTRANQLASYLIDQGIGRGDLVPVSTPRGPDMVIAMLAILKSGAAYVPLDPSFPAQRKQRICQLVKADLVLSHSSCSRDFDPDIAPVIEVDLLSMHGQPTDNVNVAMSSADLAYVIFTSGSTGEPKGVMLQHAPVVNLIEWVNQRYRVDHTDKVLFVTSMSFDLSVYDIFGLLAAGGVIYLADEEECQDPQALVNILQTQGITYWDSAPAALNQLTAFFPESGSDDLRLVFLSGDWIPLSLPSAVQSCFRQAKVVGLGGATEAAIWSNFFEVTDIESHWNSIPYGKPIQNARYYVLDDSLRPCPEGVVGDLYIGGQCLSRGYFNQPALSAQRYLPDPYSPVAGGVLYCTGDRSRVMADGNLEFIGRVDHQIKLRGYRIELGEIESVIKTHSGVKEVLAMVREDNGRQVLVAYIEIHKDQVFDQASLSLLLSDKLPAYMVPSAFICLNSWPVTPNGKLDRNALPAPEADLMLNDYEAPSSSLEVKIGEIWQSLLGVERVGRKDNFFSLRGDSILVVRFCAHVREAFGVEVPVRWLFESPTLASIVQRLDALIAASQGPLLLQSVPRKAAHALSFAQQRLWFLQRLNGNSAQYNIPWHIRIDGEVDPDIIQSCLRLVVARHEAFRCSFTEQHGVPVAVLQDTPELSLDIRTVAQNDSEALQELREKDAKMPFDLAQAPLIRVTLVIVENSHSELLLNIHHIISDGWSMGILFREFCEAYNCALKKKLWKPLALPMQYIEFAEWQKAQMQSDHFAHISDNWLGILAQYPHELRLNFDYPVPLKRTYEGKLVRFSFNSEIAKQLNELAMRHDTTLYVVLLSAFNMLLYTQCDQDRFLVGSPNGTRRFKEMESVVGFFVDNLVVPCDLSGKPNFSTLLEQTKHQVWEAFAHQDVPFDLLVDKLGLRRSLERAPLIQALFTLQNQPMSEVAIAGLEFCLIENNAPYANFELALGVFEGEDGLSCAFQYATELFAPDTIKQLLQRFRALIAAIVRDPAMPFDGVVGLGSNLSQLQKNLLVGQQYYPNDNLYNLQAINSLPGDLDEGILISCLQYVIEDNDILRQYIVVKDGVANMVTAALQDVGVDFVDWRDLDNPEGELDFWLQEQAKVPVNIYQPPRTFRLIRLTDDVLVLSMRYHHMFTDGASCATFLNRLYDYYQQYMEHGEVANRPVIGYREVHQEFQDYIRTPRFQKAKQYWQEILAEPVSKYRFYGMAEAGGTGSVSRLLVDYRDDDLRALQASTGLSQHDLMLSVLFSYLAKVSGNTKVSVGVVLHNRSSSLTKQSMGLQMQIVPLIMEVSHDDSFLELVSKVRSAFRQCVKHGRYMLDAALVKNHLDVLYNYHVQSSSTICGKATQNRWFAPDKQFSSLEVQMLSTGFEEGSRKQCFLDFRSDLFDSGIQAKVARHFANLIVGVAEQPNRPLSQVSVMDEPELRQVLSGFSAGGRDPELASQISSNHARFTELVQHTCKHYPDVIAVRDEDGQLTYRELWIKAQGYAKVVRSQICRPGEIVPLLGDRSCEYISAVLGTLLAGAAYLPIHPSLPDKRIEVLLDQSQASIMIVTDNHFKRASQLRGQGLIRIIGAPDMVVGSDWATPASNPQQLAYVIFTSGSTGVPKGAMISHQAFMNHARVMIDVLQLAQGDVVAQNAAQSFDISVWQMLVPLLVGATVEVISEEQASNPAVLSRRTEQAGITILEAVPSILRGMLDVDEDAVGDLSSLRYVIPTGENLPVLLVGEWFLRYPGIRLYNAYGPAECADDVALALLDSAVSEVPIGTPVEGALLYVLDTQLQPLPAKVTGEIYIGGDTVGLGYLGDPVKTAASFVPNPFVGNGQRIYKTGDLGFFNEQGCLFYAGRSDHQVKIRGQRLELGEIESCVLRYPGIQDCVCVLLSGGNHLAVFFESKDPIETNEIRGFLRSQLADYMVPNFFRQLGKLPRNQNGKADRKQLASIPMTVESNAQIPLTTQTELALADLWGALLPMDTFGREDDFFLLGGHSLLAAQLQFRINEYFGVDLALRHIFEHPRLALQAQFIEQLQRGQAIPIERISRGTEMQASFAQQRLWLHQQVTPDSTIYNIAGAVRLGGDVSVGALEQALRSLMDRHETLRTSLSDISGQGSVVQVIASSPVLPLVIWEGEYTHNQCREALQTLKGMPFDLKQGPLWKAELFRIDGSQYWLNLVVHHAISDAWSMGVMIRDFAVFYRAATLDLIPQLVPLALQYVDYAAWQRSYLTEARRDEQLAYWLRLADAPAVHKLPVKAERNMQSQGTGDRIRFSLGEELSKAVRLYCQTNRVTSYMVLFAAYSALISRLSGEDTVVIGTSLANRPAQALEETIGFFVNTVALKVSPGKAGNFTSLVDECRHTLFGAIENQHVPFEDVVNHINPERSAGTNPVFQLFFVLNNTPKAPTDLGDLEITSEDVEENTSIFDLTLAMQDDGAQFSGSFTFNSHLFEHSHIDRTVQRYKRLLTEVLQKPDSALRQIKLDDKVATPKITRTHREPCKEDNNA